MPKACAICYETVTDECGTAALIDVLDHVTDAHPHDETLADILNDTWVEVECRDCGQPFFSPVTYGAGKIGAEAYCPECDGEGIRPILAQELTPCELIRCEADPFEDDLGRTGCDA